MKGFVLMGLIFGIIAAGCTGKTDSFSSFDSGVEGVFSCNVGKFEVHMLVEGERDGNAGILIDAGEDVLNKYIPQEGFKHTANAFLVKTGSQNILIDSGTGAGGIIVEKLKKLGIEGDQINTVLITHLHGDHFGGLHNSGVANFPNAKIYVSSKELEFFTVTNVNQGAVNALAPYGENVLAFEPNELGSSLNELLPGISAIAAYGHTPGHTIFQVENNGVNILIVGDLLHVALVQFAIPEISATFDMDPAAAAVTRRQVLDYAASNKIPIGGMHIVNPGIGKVSVEDSGFRFKPMN